MGCEMSIWKTDWIACLFRKLHFESLTAAVVSIMLAMLMLLLVLAEHVPQAAWHKVLLTAASMAQQTGGEQERVQPTTRIKPLKIYPAVE